MIGRHAYNSLNIFLYASEFNPIIVHYHST